MRESSLYCDCSLEFCSIRLPTDGVSTRNQYRTKKSPPRRTEVNSLPKKEKNLCLRVG